MRKLRSLKDNIHGMVDLGVVLMIGIAFIGLMVFAYIIFTIKDSLMPTAPTTASTTAYNNSYAAINNSLGNITGGWDSAVSLLLIAITIFILAIAISALLMLRGSGK